ncbi:transcriptional repressor [Metabacillus idriensis]|uniref:transcriptional repressor n=1 Tax=Metabacillus idriensis TaxID=324768 RepID=UPI003D2E75E6
MIVLQLQPYVDYVREKGYKCTPQRMEILAYFFLHRNRLVSAKELYKQLHRTLGKISYDSDYRNLSLLTNIGLLEFTYKWGE